MGKIWVVGEPHHPSIEKWGEVVSVPSVVVDTPPGPGLRMRLRYNRHIGIKMAMSDALHFSSLGDLIMQNDVELMGDPFTAEAMPHNIRTLVKPVDVGHVCPQAFIVYDTETKEEILDAWNDSRHQSCIAWGHLDFVEDYIVAEHRGQP